MEVIIILFLVFPYIIQLIDLYGCWPEYTKKQKLYWLIPVYPFYAQVYKALYDNNV